MDPATFNALVASLAAKARDNPAGFRRRVRGLVALGYLYVLGVLALVLLAIVALTWLTITTRRGLVLWKFGFLLVPLAYVIVRSLWVRFPRPEGVVLDLKEVPRLARRIEEIRRALKAPRANVVILTQEYNAAVTQRPRYGLFGGSETFLILGLPYMYAMGPRQLDAVLAHEFGHLSGEHPKLGLWLGSIGRTWHALLSRLESANGLGNVIFLRFFRWYVPQLDAHSFALRREDEYAADADAARITSAKYAGQCLVTGEVRAPHYSRFWSLLLAGVEKDAHPPTKSWSLVPTWMKEASEPQEAHDALARALAREGLVEDSHPSLTMRLQRLGLMKGETSDPAAVLRDLAPTQTTFAADHYLGAVAPRQLDAWDIAWRTEATPRWRERHAEAAKLRERIEALRACTEPAGLTAEEAWELASSVIDLDGSDAGEPLVRQALALDEGNAPAHYTLGRILLARHDSAGVAHVERAMALDSEAVPAGSALLRDFRAAVGDSEGIAREEAKAHERLGQLHEKEVERSTISVGDLFLPVTLAASERLSLAKAARVRGVKALWVARKKLKHEYEKSVLVILVEPKHRWWSSFDERRAKMSQAVLETLQLDADKDPFIVNWTEGFEWIVKGVKKAGGMQVTAARGVVPVRADRWHKVHRRPLVLAGLGGAVIAFALWMFHVPTRMHDPRGMLEEGHAEQWNGQLYSLMRESGVDMRVIIDSLPPGTDLEAYALREARRLGVGRTSDRRGLLMLMDATSGSLRLEVGSQLEAYFPDGFVGRVLRAHTSGAMRTTTLTRSLVSTIFILHHRLREASLGFDYDPAGFSAITDSTRLMAGAGATFTLAAGEPLELDRVPDPGIEAMLAAGSSAEEALERYRLWLSLPVYVPRAHFLTQASRHFYEFEFPMTPAYWDYIRYLYIKTEMAVETRGDLAIAYATRNPLITPLFFRRTTEGWQMDVVAELRNSRNTVGAGYNWMLTRSGGEHDEAFADRMTLIGGQVWRFRDGANQQYRIRGSAE